jgi:hypothetical protein
VIRLRLGLVAVVALLAACGSSTPATTATAPANGGAPSAAAGCVSETTARDIWTGIDVRLNAIVLDPQHHGLTDVATGAALTDLQDYIQTTLVAKRLTEREVDRLDNLTIVDAACSSTASLQLSVSTTATRDDYLKSDGSLDHSDPAVGTMFHLIETFQRVGGVWKESAITRLDVPSPSPQVV